MAHRGRKTRLWTFLGWSTSGGSRSSATPAPFMDRSPATWRGPGAHSEDPTGQVMMVGSITSIAAAAIVAD